LDASPSTPARDIPEFLQSSNSVLLENFFEVSIQKTVLFPAAKPELVSCIGNEFGAEFEYQRIIVEPSILSGNKSRPSRRVD
jgi:hypothetical protein